MKKLFIIDSYPKTEKQIQTLKECILSIKIIGWDILLVSHYPVTTEIQEMVTYYIYDKNNLFVPPNITPHIFISNEFFDSKIYLSGHALAITINMFNGFKFAENYNYDFCYFMECDSILTNNDINKLTSLVDTMVLENKDMIVFNPKEFIVKDCYYGEDGAFFYETLLFGAKTTQFLLNFKPPRNLEEWYSNDMCYNLESSFHHKFKHLKDKCLIIPNFVSDYLSESNINKHRFGMFVCDIINNETNPETPILFINNLYESNTTKEIKIFENGQYIDTVTSQSGTWFYKPLSNGNKIKIEVFEKNIFDYSEEYFLSDIFIGGLKNKLSNIKFK